MSSGDFPNRVDHVTDTHPNFLPLAISTAPFLDYTLQPEHAMENIDQEPVEIWVSRLKGILRKLADEQTEAVIAASLVEIIQSYNAGKPAEQTARHVWFMP